MLPPLRQQAIKEAWEEYYDWCKKSPAGENFFAQAKAFSQGRMQEVKERAEFAKGLRENGGFRPAPSIFPFSPIDLEQSSEVRCYRMNNSNLKRLREQQNEVLAEL